MAPFQQNLHGLCVTGHQALNPLAAIPYRPRLAPQLRSLRRGKALSQTLQSGASGAQTRQRRMALQALLYLGETLALALRRTAQSRAQTAACEIKALARPTQHIGGLRHGPQQSLKVTPPTRQQPQRTALHTRSEITQPHKQIGPDRHHHFSRPCRGRGPLVSDEIKQRPVRFMPHRTDQRDQAGRSRLHHTLVVKTP